MAAIELAGVSFSYGARMALTGVSFSIPAGESFGIMGPNGSGKSTLFGILTTRLCPSTGSFTLLETDAARQPEVIRSMIGIVPQGATLDRFLTVEENLSIWASLMGMSGPSARSAVAEALDAAGLEDRKTDRAGTLSGGLARRAELARALLHRPEVLLLDEPASSLDPAARVEWRERLTVIRRERHLTVVAMTHDLDEAERCDRVAILSAGKIMAVDTPGRLRESVGAPVITVTCAGDPAPMVARLSEWLGVTVPVIDGRIRFTHPDAHAVIPKVAEIAGPDAIAIMVSRPSLDQAFVSLTGSRWEDSR